MDVRLPNGQLIRGVPDGTAKEDIQRKAIAAGLATEADFPVQESVRERLMREQPGEYDPSSPEWQAKYGPTAGTGPVQRFFEGAGAGMSDLAYGAGQLVGLVDPEDVREKQRIDAPLMETTAGKVGSFTGQAAVAVPTTFIPGANTVAGATLIGGGIGALQPVTDENILLAKALNTGTGAALGYGGHKVGNWVGNKVSDYVTKKTASRASQAAQNTIRDTSLRQGQELGFRVNPTQAKPSLPNRVLEGWAGKVSTAQRVAEKNQPITNKVARQSLGLSDDVPLTPEALSDVRRGAGAVYENLKNLKTPIVADKKYFTALAKIGQANKAIAKDFPELAKGNVDDLVSSLSKNEFSPAGAVEAIKILRRDAKTLFKSDDPSRVALARASKEAADALEDVMERNLEKLGNSALIQQFKNARKLIAKSYTVEDALNPGSGNVVAGKLAHSLKKGAPLEGDLKKVAQFSATFPKATQEIISSNPGFSPLDVYAGSGMASMAQMTQNPGAVRSFLAAALGRPVARELIASRPYQRMMTNPNYSNTTQQMLARMLARPELRAGAAIPGPLIYAEQQ